MIFLGAYKRFTPIAIALALAAPNVVADSKLKLTNEEAFYLESTERLSLCVGPDAMPLDDIQNGRHTGIGAEFIKLFETRIGITIDLVATPTWDQSIENVKSGKCDLIGLIAQTPQRSQFLDFTKSYVKIPFVVVTTQEKFFLSNIDALADKPLAIHKGYSYVEIMRNRFPNIDLLEVDDIEQGLDLVNKGKKFGYLSGLQIAGYAIQNGGYSNLKISGQFDEFTTIELGLGIAKHRGPLVSIFNKAIDSIEPEKLNSINNSWLTIKYQIVEDHQRLYQVGGVAFIILLFLLYQKKNLQKHNLQLETREKEIWHQANFDFLTSLPNRRYFQKHLEKNVNRNNLNAHPFALMLIDLDGFKEINDSLGHDQGDVLLIETTLRIKQSINAGDMLARLGGDEFIVLINRVDSITDSDIDGIANKIIKSLSEVFILKEEVYVSASVGITLCPEDSSDMLELMKNVDQALHSSKEKGRNIYQHFVLEMRQAADSRMEMIRDLHSAIENKEFEVYYQPIVDFKSKNIYKCEALIRWNHPTKGQISPFFFIPILEESRMIIEVGEWIFLESAKQSQKWRKKYKTNFQISVNTSPVQFQSRSTLKWESFLREQEIDISAIGIEITESMLMEGYDDITDHLTNLRDSGFQISLDDFGTGYSSLSYLKKFDIDYLKIDKSFVDNLEDGSNDLVLCEAIIVMAHKLGLKVIAEGVETEHQQALLESAGCDYGQGYLFSKPVPAKEFESNLLEIDQQHRRYN